MNPKSLIIAIVVAFVTVAATDFLIHGLWLGATYKATASLWRPEAEMNAMRPLMMLAEFFAATAFTIIFAACVAEKRCMSCTMKYSASMGIFSGAGQFMMYCVQPLPGSLAAKWVLAAIAQALVLGFIIHKVYKPAPIATGK